MKFIKENTELNIKMRIIWFSNPYTVERTLIKFILLQLIVSILNIKNMYVTLNQLYLH